MAKLDLSGTVAALRLFYTDKMDISGYIDGVLTPKEADVDCRISFSRPDSVDPASIDRDKEKLVTKIFCDTDVPVAKGDWITIRRISRTGQLLATYEGHSALPIVRSSHQEFELLQEGQA